MIRGDGWEALHRNPLSSLEAEWQPVAFFVPVTHSQGMVVVTLVLVDGQLVASNGKLRRV
jgi:hypothetical protein